MITIKCEPWACLIGGEARYGNLGYGCLVVLLYVSRGLVWLGGERGMEMLVTAVWWLSICESWACLVGGEARYGNLGYGCLVVLLYVSRGLVWLGGGARYGNVGNGCLVVLLYVSRAFVWLGGRRGMEMLVTAVWWLSICESWACLVGGERGMETSATVVWLCCCM